MQRGRAKLVQWLTLRFCKVSYRLYSNLPAIKLSKGLLVEGMTTLKQEIFWWKYVSNVALTWLENFA
jgi:hypothetical protein